MSPKNNFNSAPGRLGARFQKEKEDRSPVIVEANVHALATLQSSEENKIKPTNRDRFSFRNSKEESSILSGEEKLKYLIKQTEDELVLLHEVRSYMLDPDNLKIPKPGYRYLQGQTIDMINEKIESRENDLDVLEDGLEDILKNKISNKDNSQIPEKYPSNADTRRAEAREKILRFENSMGKKNKIRHWPPEGFVQKTGTIKVWPPVVDNLKNFETKKSQDGAELPNKNLIDKIDEELLKAETFLEDAESKGEKLRAEFYKNEIEQLKDKLKKQIEVAQSQETIEESGEKELIPKNKEERKNLKELGYSDEDIKNIRKGEDLINIHKNQIQRDEWFNGKPTQIDSEHGKVSLAYDGAPAESTPGSKNTGNSLSIEAPPGSDVRVSIESQLNTSLNLNQSDALEKKQAPDISKEKEEVKNELDNKNQEESDYEKRKEELSANGWTKEKYEALSKEDRGYVYWNRIQEDVFSFSVVLIERRKLDGKVALKNTEEDEFFLDKKEKINTVIRYLLGREKNKPSSDLETKISEAKNNISENKIYPIPKPAEDFIKAENQKRAKEAYDLTAKGVSAGAKEFIKGERVLADELHEKQKFSSSLERGYKNLDKNKLIEIAKARGLTSGGDKQQVIDRLIEDDIKNNRENFGFASPEIKDKFSEYGMSEKSIIMISPEFFSLSPEKQRYLISKIEQKIYLTADLQSKDKNEEEIKGMGFFKKAFATFGKDQRQVALRDKIIAEIKTKGLVEYGPDIATINSYLLDAPDLKYVKNERGRLVPEFQYMETNTSNDKNLETVKNFFNVAASRFGEIPYEWSLKTATSSQKEAYRKARESYESAKSALSKTMLDNVEKQYPGASKPGSEDVAVQKYKDAQTQAMLTIRKADAGVNFGRYITQNPEMEKLTATWTQKILGTDLGNWGRGAGYAAAGFATKYFGRTMTVTGVGFLVAGAVGGFLADRKKRLEFDAKELRKRYGKDVEDLGIKKSVNSENVHERLEKLVNQFEKATDEKSKARILETIKTRLFVTDEMMRDGRISFGKTKDQTFNQFKLSDLMSKASVLVEMNGGFSEEKSKEEEVFENFKQFIKDDEAQKARNGERRLAALKGAGIAAFGFGAGAGLRIAQEAGVFGAAANFISENASTGFEKIKYANSAIGGVTKDWLGMKELAPDTYSSLQDNQNFGASFASTESVAYAPAMENAYQTFESVDVGSRGMIGGIDDLQDKIREKFGNNIPEQYQEFMAKKPEEVARDWGTYRPGEENESAKVFKGAKFEIGKNGEVIFTDHEGASQKVFSPETGTAKNFNGEFFDAGNRPAVSPESSLSDTNYESGADARPASPEVNEGYVTTRTIKPETTSWYEKPVPTEYGASPVRGSWKFVEDANGNIVKVDTSRTISDDVIKFRQNPRSFMTKDLSSTNLLAKTDSFAVKTLTDNRELVEKFLVEKNLLDAPPAGVIDKELSFLKESVSQTNKELQIKTGGAFDGKLKEEPSLGRVEKTDLPTAGRNSYFETDGAMKPRVSPSVTSVSEGSDFVPPKETALVKAPEVASVSPIQKNYEVSFGERAGKKFIPVSVESSWNLDKFPKIRQEAMSEMINPKYHNALKFNPDFDRLVVAQEFLDSGKYPVGSSDYTALKDYVAGQENKISSSLRAEDVFETESNKISLGGREFTLTSNTKVDINNESLKEIARKYITDGRMGYSGNMFALGPDHVGVYEESTDQATALKKINLLAGENADKIGSVVEEKYLPGSDGKYRLVRVYKLKK